MRWCAMELTLTHILAGAVVLVLAAVLVAMAFRPGSVEPTHFVDKDADGVPDDDVTDADRQAAIEADGKPLD